MRELVPGCVGDCSKACQPFPESGNSGASRLRKPCKGAPQAVRGTVRDRAGPVRGDPAAAPLDVRVRLPGMRPGSSSKPRGEKLWANGEVAGKIL